jgi:hypothetical protein
MKIVHVELPRFFTLSVKEYMTETASALQSGGHEFAQYDINPNFWRWLMALSTPHSPGDCFEAIVAAGSSQKLWPAMAELQAHFRDIGRLYGVPVNLQGLGLSRAVVESSYAMCSLVADNFGCALFANFFSHVDERLGLRQADVVTLGLDNPEGVFWALQLASWLRTAGSSAHIGIARHSWENYSLLHHIDDLAKNAWFFSVIDSVILYQEEIAQTMRSLVAVLDGSAPAEDLHNIAIKTGDAVRVIAPRPADRTAVRIADGGYRIPHEYFTSMCVPLEDIVYCMSMVRNKCFYKKCSFCVQVAKHISDNAYSEAADVKRSLDACQELLRHGVGMVNFMDEAMRPVDLRDFCAGLQERQLRIHWVGRMIAAANPSVDLLHTMKEAGCIEVLFGLETFDHDVAADMGKVSRSHHDAGVTSAMIERFLDAGLFLILSMIYEFPTETNEARQRTLNNMDELFSRTGRVATIFNRFHLFHKSRMYQDPAAFNIKTIQSRLPENDLQYYFDYDCERPHPPATAAELATMHRLTLGLREDRYAALLNRHGRDLLDMAYFLDYGSMGFRQRAEHDSVLSYELFAATAD